MGYENIFSKTHMLEVIDLKFDYADRSFNFDTNPLLNNINFTLAPGTLMHIRGSNGSGKTTLLKLLTGLLYLEHGEIFYAGQSILSDRASYQANLCYVGHKNGISKALTVYENCIYDLQSLAAGDSTFNKELINQLLMQFSLFEYKDTFCGLLSSGQCRRVALIRLMLSKKPLWILDEPLVALDQAGIDLFLACLVTHLQQGGQVIITSHQPLTSMQAYSRELCL